MPRAGLTRERLVDIALELGRSGSSASLGAVARVAGVKTPSLYKHVASASELSSLVAERALTQFADALTLAVGDAQRTEAARRFLHAYRSFAISDPHLFSLIPLQPGNDPRLRPIAQRLMRSMATALGFTGPTAPGALHALRFLRSCADGFVRLELAGGFGEPIDVNESWDHLVEATSKSTLLYPA